MAKPPEAWKRQLVPATFRRAEFHVEMRETGSGRRVVIHEFPKRDDPYAEDMGRRARRFTVSGYVVGSDYLTKRNALIDACEQEGAGELVLPTQGGQQVNCDHYSIVERRVRGRFCEFEMTFVEAGALPKTRAENAAPVGVTTPIAAPPAADAAKTSLDTGLVGAGAADKFPPQT